MLAHGAEQVLIDRRAASSPAVSAGLVIATGAMLSEDIREVDDERVRHWLLRSPRICG